jgi:hypothetical protein
MSGASADQPPHREVAVFKSGSIMRVDAHLRSELAIAKDRLKHIEGELESMEGAFVLFKIINASVIDAMRARAAHMRGIIAGLQQARDITEQIIYRRGG